MIEVSLSEEAEAFMSLFSFYAIGSEVVGTCSRSSRANANASAKETRSSTLMTPALWMNTSSASRRSASGRAKVLVHAVRAVGSPLLRKNHNRLRQGSRHG